MSKKKPVMKTKRRQLALFLAIALLGAFSFIAIRYFGDRQRGKNYVLDNSLKTEVMKRLGGKSDILDGTPADLNADGKKEVVGYLPAQINFDEKRFSFAFKELRVLQVRNKRGYNELLRADASGLSRADGDTTLLQTPAPYGYLAAAQVIDDEWTLFLTLVGADGAPASDELTVRWNAEKGAYEIVK